MCVNRNNFTIIPNEIPVTTFTWLIPDTTTSTYTNKYLWKNNEVDFELFADKCCLLTSSLADSIVKLGKLSEIDRNNPIIIIVYNSDLNSDNLNKDVILYHFFMNRPRYSPTTSTYEKLETISTTEAAVAYGFQVSNLESERDLQASLIQQTSDDDTEGAANSSKAIFDQYFLQGHVLLAVLLVFPMT